MTRKIKTSVNEKDPPPQPGTTAWFVMTYKHSKWRRPLAIQKIKKKTHTHTTIQKKMREVK